MELKNDFHLAIPIERAWEVLTDVELIAGCVPGAEVTEVKKTAVHGTIAVKAGPLTLGYVGKARILKRDRSARTAILRAEGTEPDGPGKVQADVKAHLSADAAGTNVALSTHVDATGRLAQLGQGMLEDVAALLLARFVTELETTVLAAELVEAPAADQVVAASVQGLPESPDPAPTADGARSPQGLAEAGTTGDGATDDDANEATGEGDANGAGGDVADEGYVAAPAVEVAPTASRTVPPTAAPEPSQTGAGGSPPRGPARRVAPVLGAVALAWLVRTLVRRRRR